MDKNEEKSCRDCFEKLYPRAEMFRDGEYKLLATEACWQAFTEGWEAYKEISEAENSWQRKDRLKV